ncbi:MAG: VanZ family protein [Candidatus Eisenbacteria bacterium]
MALAVEPGRARAAGRKRSGRRSRLPWALAWSGLMIAASSVPKIPTAPPPLLHHDKILHLIEYGVFAWLWGEVFRGSRREGLRRRAFAIVVLGGLVWAALDEVYQGTVGRSRDPMDFLADAVAIVAVQTFQEWRKRRAKAG